MATLKFRTNINCGNCIRTVTPFLNELDSIESWKVDAENTEKVLTVEGDDTSVEEVIDAIKSAGFKAEFISKLSE